MKNIQALKTLLSSPKNIVVTVHHRPDADALGAGLGLAALLKKQHHQVHVIVPTDYPAFLNWLPNVTKVIIYTQEQQKKSYKLLGKADIIFCLDCPTLNRLGTMAPAVRDTKATKVIIDHHFSVENMGDLIFRDTNAAATAELLYEIIEAWGVQDLIDQDVAECLYAGIVTDTDSFKNANTTARTHLVVAQLIYRGVNIVKVNRLLYANNSLNKLAFLSFALRYRLVVIPEYNTAYFVIYAKDYEKYQLQTGDTEGLVDYALSIQGIKLAAVIKEKSNSVRLSFRSLGEIPVNMWAQQYFDGGGHKNAAGGSSHLSLAATVSKFEKLVKSMNIS